MTHEITTLVAQYGLWLVFLGVLGEQLGLPIPAVPLLVVAGSLAAFGHLSVAGIIAVALLACLAGDLAWYAAGRRYGLRVMSALCRVSLSPDSCVYQSEVRFERWRGQVLIAAKFVPGLSLVAPPLAGALGLPLRAFLLFDGLGALLWVGVAVAVGDLFASRIDGVLDAVADAGSLALGGVLALLAVYIAVRWWRRRRDHAARQVPSVAVAQLRAEQAGMTPPVVVDVRSRIARRADPRVIEGALLADVDHVADAVRGIPHWQPLVPYCSCPHEATSARAAASLLALGYRNVRPLRGGLPAWDDAGYPVQSLPPGDATGGGPAAST